jgi:hypothetical protein
MQPAHGRVRWPPRRDCAWHRRVPAVDQECGTLKPRLANLPVGRAHPRTEEDRENRLRIRLAALRSLASACVRIAIPHV